MARLDIDQARAKYAFTSVSSVDKIDDKEKLKKAEALKKKYGSQVEKLPMMIHNSGLRNTLAFAYAKGYLKQKEKQVNEWQLIFDQIFNWFAEKEPTNFFGTTFKKQENDKDVATANIKVFVEIEDAYQYRFATQETIALVNWLRKLVKGD